VDPRSSYAAPSRSPSPQVPEPRCVNREHMLEDTGTAQQSRLPGTAREPNSLTRNGDNQCLRSLMNLPFSRRPSRPS
jgi:hypothetical protein